MRDRLQQKVEDLSENGYHFNFGEYISEGAGIFGKYAGGFIGFSLLYFVIYFFVGIIPILGGIVNAFISTTLLAGIYIVAHKIKTQQHYEFGDFFAGFQKFGEIIVMTLITWLIYLALMIPFVVVLFISFDVLNGGLDSILNSPTPPSNFPFWAFIFILPFIYLSVAYVYATMFIVFYDAQPWESLEASRKVITKNWFIIFVFLVVVGILAMLGFVALFIGVFVTAPIMIAALYASFADVTGLVSDENEEEDIMDHLVV